MSRLFSILIIGLGGYYLIKKRYRWLNLLLRNQLVRQYLVNIFMNLPGLRNKMMNSLFSKPTMY